MSMHVAGLPWSPTVPSADGEEHIAMVKYEVQLARIQRVVMTMFGEGVCLSYPLPDITKAIWVERFFIYPAGSRLMRSRPFGMLTVERESGNIIAYQDCRWADFMDADQHPFETLISYELPRKITVKEFKVEQGLINKLYESVRCFAFHEELTQEEKETLSKYMVLLLRSVPVSLLPYYQKMGKNFFRWGYCHV